MLGSYQHVIDGLTLIPGSGGAYEVLVNGDSIYSKKATGRHAEAGEVFASFKEIVGPDVMIYGT